MYFEIITEGVVQSIFTGHEYDEETGLTYANARYYDAALGRWINQDPLFQTIFSEASVSSNTNAPQGEYLGNPQNLNGYSYVINNPLRYKDPTGKTWQDYVKGYLNSVSSNAAFGAGRMSSQSADFQRGQTGGDITSMLIGSFEAALGVTTAAGGAAGAVITSPTGVGAVAGVAVSAEGVAMTAHGAGMATTAATHLSQEINLDDIIPPARQKHILEGEPGPNGQWGGGHRAGTGKGKAEFPSSWSDKQILKNAADVATDPKLNWEKQGHGTYKVTGNRGGIDMSVIINKAKSIIISAFPKIFK